MNQGKKVFRFVILSVALYFLFSLAAIVFGFHWKPFENINILSELFTSGEDGAGTKAVPGKNKVQPDNPVTGKPAGARDATFYKTPGYITNFNPDTLQPSMGDFLKKLYSHKVKRKKSKIRIAYFGDSMIEGDLIVGTFRHLMQKEFGGTGAGFVPVKSITAGFRQTVTAQSSGNWSDVNFKSDKVPGNLYLSGHLFRSNGGSLEMKNKVNTDSAASIQKFLLCGKANGPFAVTINDVSKNIAAPDEFNNILVGEDRNNSIRVSVPSSSTPVYGISFEGADGVIVDNFSFRGISGVEYAKIDEDFLRAIQKGQQYDLIVFQYGVNLLFRPRDKDYSWYKRLFLPVVQKFKSAFPGTDIMIVSTADRAFRYGTEYKTAIGISSLIQEQADIAYSNNVCFYNLFETMGGENSIVRWAAQKPSLANKDYIHFNHKGAEVIGEFLFKAILKEYKKYEAFEKK